ncbi:MAG: hypothetical protein JWP20_1347, partial [Roseomonas sp.]|nr:hypothetical protein [Roseomonas sp.]
AAEAARLEPAAAVKLVGFDAAEEPAAEAR